MKDKTIRCGRCRKPLGPDEVYGGDGCRMCDDCAMTAGLFPLEHTGPRRDRISERGRHLTVPKP